MRQGGDVLKYLCTILHIYSRVGTRNIFYSVYTSHERGLAGKNPKSVLFFSPRLYIFLLCAFLSIVSVQHAGLRFLAYVAPKSIIALF